MKFATKVLLAIRGLGKSKAVMQQLSTELRRPERAVIHLSQSYPAKGSKRVEAFLAKDAECTEMIKHILRFHMLFLFLMYVG